MNALFDGKWSPITDTFGFLRCNHLRAAEAFYNWQDAIQKKRGVSLRKRPIHGKLASAMENLLPLTSVERRRYLFIPTQSEWTAFLDNGHQGTDAFSSMSYLAKELSCEAVRATYVPEGRKDYPAVILEIYGPNPSYFLNYVRSISCAYDGKKWSFAVGGEALPFEDVESYSKRHIKERFTPEMLADYLKALGIKAFDENFYLPDDDSAEVIEKTGPIAPTARKYQLADLQLA